MSNMRRFLFWGAVFILGVVFIWLYASFGLASSFCRGAINRAPTETECIVTFNSPDETANYFWITRFAEGASLYYEEPLNRVANNLIHPRSMNVVGDRVVPGSFLGMIVIYGTLAKVFGTGVIPWLTPAFAILGVIFFGLLVSKIFSRDVGIVTALLAASCAPWWYVASRGMYHNTLFVALLIIGLYFLYEFVRRGRSRFWLPSLALSSLSAFFLGLSLLTRLSEIGWVSALVFLIILVNIKKIYWPGMILLLCTLGAMMTPFIVANYQLYGSALTIGYQTIGGGNLAHVLAQIHLGGFVKLIFLPFGFVPGMLKFTVTNYVIKIFWWWAVLTGIGFVYWLLSVVKRSQSQSTHRVQAVYVTCYLLLVTLLLLFYGSWGLVDRIDKSQFSIGTSFVRYWLPLYLGALPLIALFLIQITSWARARAVRVFLLAFLIGSWGYASVGIVMRDTDESLLHIQKNLTKSATKAQLFARELPKNALYIIYPQLDKVMFPHFKRLLTGLVVPEDYRALRLVLEREEVYYITFAPPEAVAAISRRDFEPHGMHLVEGRRIDDWDWVYKVVKK